MFHLSCLTRVRVLPSDRWDKQRWFSVLLQERSLAPEATAAGLLLWAPDRANRADQDCRATPGGPETGGNPSGRVLEQARLVEQEGSAELEGLVGMVGLVGLVDWVVLVGLEGLVGLLEGLASQVGWVGPARSQGVMRWAG